MNYNLHKVSFIFAISIVCSVLPINAEAKIKHLDYHLEYVSKVAVETGNIWKRNLINPLSKIWQPWFSVGNTEIYTRGGTNKKITEETVAEKNVGEVLSVSIAQSTIAPSQVTTQEVLAWLKDLFLLQQTQNYSGSPTAQVASPVIHQYYTSGVTQGLADSVGRSIKEINTSIGGGLESLQANGVFNTSVLSVDTVNTRVGIGTSSPTDTLSVNGPAYFAQISAPSNTSNRLYNVGGDLYWAGNLIGGASSGNWATDGTSVWRASGNVGIGTTTPFAKLSVESTAGSAQFVVGSSTATQFIVDKNGKTGIGTANPTIGGLEVNNTGSTFSSIPANTVGLGIISQTGWGGTGFAISNSANNAFSMVHVGSTSYFGRITGSATNHWMRLTDTGLRYGTSGDAAVNRLDIEGSAAFGSYAGTAAPTNGLIVSGNVGIGTTTPWGLLSVNANGLTSGAPQFVVGSSTATNFIVTNGGNVGIGTSNPGQKLDVNGNIAIQQISNDPTLQITAITSGTARLNMTGAGGGAAAINGVSTDLYFQTNSSSRMVVKATTGNVGVGTTSPLAKLSVESTAGSAQFVIGSSTATQFIVDRNGNVGVGTSAPGFPLHVNGNAMIGATVPTYIPAAPLNLVNSAGGNMKTQLSLVNTGGGDGAGSAIDFFTYDLSGGTNPGLKIAAYDNNYSADFAILTKNPGSAANAITEKFRITNTGNVGIGTSTPWRTLSVNGTVAMPALVNDSTGYYVCLNTTTGQMATSTSACGASSERFKENIQDIGYGLEEVLALRPVSFDYKADYIPNAPKQLGFIAEEVDLTIPELVARDEAGQIQGLDYPKFAAVIVKAIQELNVRLNSVMSHMEAALAWFGSDGKFKVQKDICVDDVCVTKDQFRQLLLNAAVGATQTVDGSPEIVGNNTEEENGGADTATSTPEIQTDTETDEANASTTPEIIPNTPEETASTTPETVIEAPSETASTTSGTE